MPEMNRNDKETQIEKNINENPNEQVGVSPASLKEKTRNLRKYMYRGEKMIEGDAQDYVNQLRENDRF